MRFELLALLGGCTITNVGEPIGIVVEDLGADDVANLEESATCWNMQFGTHFVVGSEARKQLQQVHAFYDRLTCIDTHAQVQGTMPISLAVCPHEFWTQPVPGRTITPFMVFSHELGHVLNIVGHPDDPYAVMRIGGSFGAPMFRPADIELFTEANPDFTQTAQCTVIRNRLPSGIGHCTCR